MTQRYEYVCGDNRSNIVMSAQTSLKMLLISGVEATAISAALRVLLRRMTSVSSTLYLSNPSLFSSFICSAKEFLFSRAGTLKYANICEKVFTKVLKHRAQIKSASEQHQTIRSWPPCEMWSSSQRISGLHM